MARAIILIKFFADLINKSGIQKLSESENYSLNLS